MVAILATLLCITTVSIIAPYSVLVNRALLPALLMFGINMTLPYGSLTGAAFSAAILSLYGTWTFCEGARKMSPEMILVAIVIIGCTIGITAAVGVRSCVALILS